MPVDFDVDVEETAASVIETLTAPVQTSTAPETALKSLEEELDEVERRLEQAQYYKLLLKAPLFDDDSEIARLVVRELREFVQTRLRVLMGVEPEHNKATVEDAVQQVLENHFTADGIKALQILAGTVLKKKIVTKTSEPSEQPLKRGPGRPRKQPSLTLVSVPKEIRSEAAAIPPSVTNVQAPTPKSPSAAPVNPALLKEGDVITENGRTYKMMSRPGKDGPTLFPTDITPQAKPERVKPVPMPVGPALTNVMFMQASAEAAKNLGGAPGEIQKAVSSTITE